MNASIKSAGAGIPVVAAQPASSSWLGRRRTWLAVAAIAVVGGAALNWGWLVAVGAAPLLLALAPCAAMCALGLCMKRGGDGCKKQDAGVGPTAAPASAEAGERSRA
ncbi:MAG: hypothetical protein K2Z25_18290 [Beijerinckiaceae bacterium]|nr:hypothetical protein [Beijerinckiaceae bacterium]